MIKIDMVHEIPAANRNSKGLNKHFQYHSIVGLNLNKKNIIISIKYAADNIPRVHTYYIRVHLKNIFALEFHQRCTLAPRSQNI